MAFAYKPCRIYKILHPVLQQIKTSEKVYYVNQSRHLVNRQLPLACIVHFAHALKVRRPLNMFLVALICVSLSVLSVRCQPTVDSETCSIRNDSFYDVVRFAVSEFRQANDEQYLKLLQLEQKHHEEMLNMTEELKSFIRNLGQFAVPIHAQPRHASERGKHHRTMCLRYSLM